MTLKGRWAILALSALAISLAVNFAWLGFTASHMLRDREPRPVAAERLVSLGARSLPKALRESVAAKLAPQDAALRAGFQSVREARRAVFEAMRAEPFDRAAVAAAFATLRGRLEAVSSIGQDAILDALAETTPEIRSTIQPPPDRGMAKARR